MFRVSIIALIVALGLCLAGVVHSYDLGFGLSYVAEARDGGDSADGDGDTEYC